MKLSAEIIKALNEQYLAELRKRFKFTSKIAPKKAKRG